MSVFINRRIIKSLYVSVITSLIWQSRFDPHFTALVCQCQTGNRRHNPAILTVRWLHRHRELSATAEPNLKLQSRSQRFQRWSDISDGCNQRVQTFALYDHSVIVCDLLRSFKVCWKLKPNFLRLCGFKVHPQLVSHGFHDLLLQ